MSIATPAFTWQYNQPMAVSVSNTVGALLLLGVCEVAGGEVRDASAELRAECDALAGRLRDAGYSIPEEARVAVRKLLKLGGFSPTGRNRPAQELLMRDLEERGEFHYINNVVDVNNLVSLESLLPISIFDTGKLNGGVTVRIATEGEGYVFNQSGQYMDVKRSIICATGGEPGRAIGSPVKDSMETKVFPGAAGVLAVIYANAEFTTRDAMLQVTERMAQLLARETGGKVVQVAVV